MSARPYVQAPLFEAMGLAPAPRLPYQPHSATSKAAAQEAKPAAAHQRERVLAHLKAAGEAGATDEEMQTALHLEGSTQRPRRVELVTARLARDSGRTRATRSGRRAAVWIAA